MLYIDQFNYYIPNTFYPIETLISQTNLPQETLNIFKRIYGLSTIPIENQLTLSELIMEPQKKLRQTPKIDYLFYIHTASLIAPFGFNLNNCLLFKKPAITLSITAYKCVSFFKALSILSKLFTQRNKICAAIITGEIAYTPSLRLAPRSSIIGDASTITLLSNQGEHHELQSIEIYHLKNYAKGIYLHEDEMRQLDNVFIVNMVKTISSAIINAKLTLQQIQLLLPHNINIPTWKKIASTLTFPYEKIFTDNIPRFGHCFCSDQIINLSDAITKKILQKGDYYLMAACGMGFYFAATVFRY